MVIDYREGEVYFRLTFPDAALLFPIVETLVYVGKNLSDEDSEDIWYFQFAEGYAKSGSIMTSKGGDRRVVLATRSELADILTLNDLNQELGMASARRADRARK